MTTSPRVRAGFGPSPFRRRLPTHSSLLGILPLFATLLLGCGGSSAPGDEHHDEHDKPGAPRVVELSPEAEGAARLVVEPAVTGLLRSELTVAGRIALDPRREAMVSAWIGGQVDAIAVRTGDTVKARQVLATVQSPELGEAVGAYRAAKARDVAADARLERLRSLLRDGVASQAQVLEADAAHAEADGVLEAAEERLRVLGVDAGSGSTHDGSHYPSHVPVRSPIAGKVLKTELSTGRRVQPGDALFHIGDLSEVWLMLHIYERDLSAVREGQAVRFTVEAWPGVKFEGVVQQVGDWVEPSARTVEVRVVVPNPDARLKPNMYAVAHLTLASKLAAEGVLLPAQAVTVLDGVSTVFVRESEGHYRAQAVEIAERTATAVRLARGISPGEIIVVEGAFTLASELEKGELGGGHGH